MSNYNLERGEELYFKEIDKLCEKHKPISTEIKILASYFSGKVGVMQDGLVSKVNFKDGSELLFELDGVPAYKKLSLSILSALVDCNTQFMKDQIEYVVQSYKDGKYKRFEEDKPKIANTETKDYSDSSKEIDDILKLTQNLTLQNLFDEDEEGNQFVRTIEVDTIDLLDDFDDEDLTTEGLRSSGQISLDFDTLESSVTILPNSSKIMKGIVEILPDGEFKIVCPYTMSSNVYQIDSSTYASFDTDQPFKVSFNLNDLKPDQD